MFPESLQHASAPFGRIEVICGSMFSGKTVELMRRVERARRAGLSALVLKPVVDARHAPDLVVSHEGATVGAIAVETAGEIAQRAAGHEVIAIDEAQFFGHELVAVCNALADAGHRVIAAGLDMDFKGAPFGPMPALLATAEFVTKVHAICPRTGQMAHYSHRVAQGDDLVLLGDESAYEPLSRAAYARLRQTGDTGSAANNCKSRAHGH